MIIHANDQPKETLENYSGGKGRITLCLPVTASRWMTALPKALQPAMCSIPPMAAPMAFKMPATETLLYWPVCCWKIVQKINHP